MEVKMPDGTLAKVEDVEIAEEKTPWTTLKLADGTVFKMKIEVVHVTRAVDKFDPITGNPTYFIKSQHIVRQSSPPKLKAKSMKAPGARDSPEVA